LRGGVSGLLGRGEGLQGGHLPLLILARGGVEHPEGHRGVHRLGGGLGLLLSVNVARKLGGNVMACNRKTGGAEVTIDLPLAALTLPADAGVHPRSPD
ncbi:MAG: hypothetical protein IIZ92_02510, partial [Aquincola sp.]|nr:hypothetical protein [Aquincola sp.]